MSPEEANILDSLDRLVWSPELKPVLQPVIDRVSGQLADRAKSVMAWEPIPLAVFGAALPPVIRSAWIFILRAGANTGAERHPNSHQRMMTFAGSGDMQIRESDNAPWKSNILVADPSLPLEQRWISIPPNVWHQPVVPPEADWVVVSFHTVPAEELIEERPNAKLAGATKQMRYLG